MARVGNPGGMARSVFSLVVGLMLMACSGAAYAYIRYIKTDDTPTTAPTGPDPGVAACADVLALHQSGGAITAVDATVVAGLAGSDNTNLQAAGEALAHVIALPEDQRAGATVEIAAALTQLAAGCAAVGVPLPSELVNPEPA
jgi:hypothetical protein